MLFMFAYLHHQDACYPIGGSMPISQALAKRYLDLCGELYYDSAFDAYDIVDFNSLGNYTEIPTTAAWIRGQLNELNYPQKPLWIGDSFSISDLVVNNGQLIVPTNNATRERVIVVLKSIADPKNLEYAANLTWLREEMARGLVKRVVVTVAVGILGINLGNLEDWKTNTPVVDALAVSGFGTSMFMGLMDTKLTGRTTAPRLPNFSQAGKARPAYYAMQLIAHEIKDFTSIEKFDLQESVWTYRFEVSSSQLWVLWYDDGELKLSSDAIPTTTVKIPWVGKTALITITPPRDQEKQPETQIVTVSNNLLNLLLDVTTIYIQPEP